MARRARVAFRSPARLCSSRRLLRAATRPNSAATKKALARTRASTAVSPRNADTVGGGSIPEKVSPTAPLPRVAVPTRLLIVLALATAWLARRPADPSKTYGYVRWEILAALVNGAALLGIAGWVVFEAIGRM